MSSAYAPLPFSYLSADGPKPRAGLRKDGVYGTSADVPRIYEEPEPGQLQRDDRAAPGYLNNPYGVYANAADNGAQQVRLDNNYETVYRPSQMPQPLGPTPRIQESPYDIRQQRPNLLEDRSQKPGGEYHVYSIPEADYVTADKDLRQREDRRPGYGNHQPEPSTSRQERVQSYFPPRDAGRQTPDIDKPSRGQKEMTPGTNDNFILVKDPSRSDQKPVSDAASALSRDAGKNKLQTLFEENGPTPTPRQNYGNTSNPSHEIGFEEPDRSLSYGLNTAERPAVNGRGTKGVTSNEHRDAKKRGEGTRCCRCNTCSAVVTAIIITAVICLGVGFVAGWFGAIADREKNAMSPTSQSTAATFIEQATNMTASANSLATTKESTSTSTSTAKTSTTSTQLQSSTATTTTTTHSSTSSETMKSSSATSNTTTRSASGPTG